MSSDISEYERERRDKRDRLRAAGVDPYGSTAAAGLTLSPLATLRAIPVTPETPGPIVAAAGRIMLKRDMGKLSFLTLRDQTGDLQVGLDRKRLTDPLWEVRGLLDLGDHIVVRGTLGVTNKGEPTIWADDLRVAAKALLPPPAKHEGLTDVEARYRQRYVDLWANPGSMQMAVLRARVVAEVRAFLAARGYLEVETPMLQPLHGGANARPFVTAHNALGMNLYLRIAPELYLKRLLVGGFAKVFELNRNFRNEGVSPRHNPEFTMLEAYEAYGTWETMADLVEEMVTTVAQRLLGTLTVEHRDPAGAVTRTINLARPWRRVTMVDLVAERTGWRFDGRPLQVAAPQLIKTLIVRRFHKDAAELAGIILRLANGEDVPWAEIDQYEHLTSVPDPFHALHRAAVEVESRSPHEQLVEVYEKLIEPTLLDPTFVTHVPSVIVPLARESTTHPGFADVYELAVNGSELSPGYSELNDPDVQAAHFAHQVGDAAERQQVDHDFLSALKYGMPPAGGFGLGIDRLIMMLTGAESIRDVILFPLMRTVDPTFTAPQPHGET